MKSLGITFVLLAIFFVTSPASALMEIGATANYRKSIINKDNYTDSVSYTASISYYFWEMSAIELSYTSGLSKTVMTTAEPNSKFTYTTSYQMAGADLVFTFASRESLIQPYIKLGGAHLEKEVLREPEGGATTEVATLDGIVPSAGIGFKVMLNKAFSIKVGVDAWKNPQEDAPDTIDYAGRAGISWFF